MQPSPVQCSPALPETAEPRPASPRPDPASPLPLASSPLSPLRIGQRLYPSGAAVGCGRRLSLQSLFFPPPGQAPAAVGRSGDAVTSVFGGAAIGGGGVTGDVARAAPGRCWGPPRGRRPSGALLLPPPPAARVRRRPLRGEGPSREVRGTGLGRGRAGGSCRGSGLGGEGGLRRAGGGGTGADWNMHAAGQGPPRQGLGGGGEGSAGGLRVRVGESLSSYGGGGGGDWHCKCNAALVCRTCAGCGVTKGETWSWVSSPASPSKCYVRRGCPAAAAARAFRETEKKRVRHLTDVAMGLVLWVGNFRNLKEGKPQEIQLAHSLHRVGKPSRLIVSRTLPRTL